MTAVRRAPAGLTGDGLALSAGVAVNAAVGVVAWWVASRFMPVAEVGRASAFVSAFIFVAGLAGLNLGVGLLRWLPAAGGRAPVLVSLASAGVAALAVLVASCYLLLPGTAPLVAAATGAPALAGAAVFVVAAAAWSVFQLHDLLLVALGASWWTPVKNLVVSGTRLAVLLVVGAGLTSQVVVGSWVVPTVACALVVGVVAARRARRADAPGALPTRREVLGFLGPTYLGQLAMSLLYFQVPVLVTLRFGPQVGGAFFVAWQAVTIVDVAALRFVNALAGHVARWPERAVELCRAARVRLLAVFLPLIAVGCAVTGPALSVFGPAYADVSGALRILLCATAVRLLVVHAMGARQALGDAWGFARLQVASSGLVVLGVLVLPADAGSAAGSVALVHLGVQTLCAAPLLLRRT